MNLQYVRFEGTVEELMQLPELRQLVAVAQRPAQEADLGVATTPEPLPQEIETFLGAEVASEGRRNLLREFLRNIVEWDGVEMTWPYSRKPDRERTPYVRARRRGSPFGAFVYLRPNGKIYFRVDRKAAASRRYAVAREVQSGNAHPVALVLREPVHLAEAVALAREAYDETFE